MNLLSTTNLNFGNLVAIKKTVQKDILLNSTNEETYDLKYIKIKSE